MVKGDVYLFIGQDSDQLSDQNSRTRTFLKEKGINYLEIPVRGILPEVNILGGVFEIGHYLLDLQIPNRAAKAEKELENLVSCAKGIN